MKWVLIAVIIYLVGMFVTKIVVIIHDHYAPIHLSFDDFEVVAIFVWFIFLPLILFVWLWIGLSKKCEDIAEWICKKLK